MNGLFEIFFGLVFGGVGFGVFLLCFLKPPGTVVENAGIGMVVGGLFALIGLFVMFTGIRTKYRSIIARKNGRHYQALVWAHESDYSVKINGIPALALVVRFKDDQGRLRQELLKTGGVNSGKYPLGGALEISEYEGTTYLVSKKAEMISIPDKEELLNPMAQVLSITTAGGGGSLTAAGTPNIPMGGEGIGTIHGASTPMMTMGAASGLGMGAAMSVACPGCGAVSMVMPGTTIVCTCGRQFKLTEDHMIV